MNAVAMKVVSAEKHPNADALFLYKMKSAEKEVEIIANLDRNYQVGDIVAIALVGSVLKDGTKIKPTKLRGIYSYGLALGKVNAEIGTDLSEIYCQPEVATEVNQIAFVKWTSIELLHNVKRELDARNQAFQLTYCAKVKLHGTNAGVRITPSGEVAAQKRTQILNPEADNAGFAAWVAENTSYFSQLKNNSHITIFGEWCGSNIQKGVAISQLERKVFAVFALSKHADVFVLPYYGEPVLLNFGDGQQLQAAADQINQMVESVEKEDPWVKANFGIEGVGEGLVMYPQVEDQVERDRYTQLIFKAKGEKHQVVKTKKAVQIEPEVAQNISEFTELFVTEARLQQALSEACDGEIKMKQMGQFLKWISLDILKESEAELAAADLTWKQVNKSVISAARNWYTNKVTNIF